MISQKLLLIMENLKSNIEILKPINDDSSYFHKTLENKLKLVIISNKKFNKSAIGIGIEVGSNQDFLDLEGIAHFVEHLVFLGSKAFPAENYLEEVLKTANGYKNATTTDRTTNYYATFDKNKLEEIVPPFIHMMIDPLFSKSSVEREINAVNAEFEGKKKLDDVRKHYLFLECLINKSISWFKAGNRQTLAKENLNQEAKRFFDEYYSSDIMSCVVATNESIEKVLSLVEPLLLKIKNKQVKNKIYVSPSETQFNPDKDKKIFFIEPVSERHSLQLNWLIPNPSFDDPHQNPLGIPTLAFSNQDKNSLVRKLKEENLIFNLNCSKSSIANGQAFFSIEVSLTDKGFLAWKSVFKRIVGMIKYFAQNPYKKELFEQSKRLNQLIFDNLSRPHPNNLVELLSTDIFWHPIQNLLTSRYLYPTEFREDLIQEAFEKVASFNNFNIFLSSKTTEEKLDLTQEHYETKYTIKDFSNDLKQILEETETSTEVDFPELNKFISNEQEKRPLLKKQTFPVRILDSPHSKIYFKQDYKLKYLKARFGVEIKTNFDGFNLETWTRLAIISNLFAEFSNELQNQISQACVSYSINFNNNNIKIRVGNFTDSAKKSLLALGKAISEFNPADFDQVKIDKHIDGLKKTINSGLKGKSINIAAEDCTSVGTQNWFTFKQRQTFISTYSESPAELKLFWENYISKVKFTWLAMGNLSEREAIKLALEFEDLFSTNICEDLDLKFHCKLKEKQDVFLIREVEEEDNKNNGIVVRYQIGENSIRSSVLQSLLLTFFGNDFFAELRTKQQIGYSVSLGYNNYKNIKQLRAQIESCDFDSFYVLNQIDLFFKEHLEKLESIEESEFQKIKGSLKESYLREHPSVASEFAFNWAEILNETFDYGINSKKEQFLCNVEKKDLISFYREELVEKRRRIISLVNAKKKDEFREEYFEKLKEQGIDAVILENDNQLKETAELV